MSLTRLERSGAILIEMIARRRRQVSSERLVRLLGKRMTTF
jgi:hypothetical protein